MFTHVMACSLTELPSDVAIKSLHRFGAPTAVLISTRWSEPLSGRELHPLKSSASHARTFSPKLTNLGDFRWTIREKSAKDKTEDFLP